MGNLFEHRDNTITIGLTNPDGSYLSPFDISDAEYAIFSRQGCGVLFRASLSGGGIQIVSSGADNVLQVNIPPQYCIAGQVSNGLKIMKDGKVLGLTLSNSNLNFIKTGF